MLPWLTEEEVDDLCRPLTQAAAQIRFIRREFGITAGRKPGGSPLVFRSELEAARARAGASTPPGKREPNRAALIAAIKKAA